jgi:hypothetical protein
MGQRIHHCWLFGQSRERRRQNRHDQKNTDAGSNKLTYEG